MSKSEWSFTLVVALLLSFFFATRCSAQELSQVVPDVKCPNTALCVKNEQGLWLPIWYARDLLKVKEDLKGRIKELEQAEEEIVSLRLADSENIEAERAMERELAFEKKHAEMMERRTKEAEAKSTKRLRWGVGTTVAGAVVIGILAAVLGAQ